MEMILCHFNRVLVIKTIYYLSTGLMVAGVKCALHEAELEAAGGSWFSFLVKLKCFFNEEKVSEASGHLSCLTSHL